MHVQPWIAHGDPIQSCLSQIDFFTQEALYTYTVCKGGRVNGSGPQTDIFLYTVIVSPRADLMVINSYLHEEKEEIIKPPTK